MEWISIKDQLPIDGEYILVYCEYGVTNHKHKIHCCQFSEKYGFDYARVTHWMKLPTPPIADETPLQRKIFDYYKQNSTNEASK